METNLPIDDGGNFLKVLVEDIENLWKLNPGDVTKILLYYVDEEGVICVWDGKKGLDGVYKQ